METDSNIDHSILLALSTAAESLARPCAVVFTNQNTSLLTLVEHWLSDEEKQIITASIRAERDVLRLSRAQRDIEMTQAYVTLRELQAQQPGRSCV